MTGRVWKVLPEVASPCTGDVVTIRRGEEPYRVLDPLDPLGEQSDGWRADCCVPITLVYPVNPEEFQRPRWVVTDDLHVVERAT